MLAWCLIDIGRDDALGRSARIVRLLELLGFILYAGFYENGGVFLNVHRYSLASLMPFLDVPVSILLLKIGCPPPGFDSATLN